MLCAAYRVNGGGPTSIIVSGGRVVAGGANQFVNIVFFVHLPLVTSILFEIHIVLLAFFHKKKKTSAPHIIKKKVPFVANLIVFYLFARVQGHALLVHEHSADKTKITDIFAWKTTDQFLCSYSLRPRKSNSNHNYSRIGWIIELNFICSLLCTGSHNTSIDSQMVR